ncbi:hypothetical protein LCGC14_3085620, partial [marine sediment metagenome]
DASDLDDKTWKYPVTLTRDDLLMVQNKAHDTGLDAVIERLIDVADMSVEEMRETASKEDNSDLDIQLIEFVCGLYEGIKYYLDSMEAEIAQAVTAKGKLLQEAHDAMDAVNGDYGSDTVISSSPVPLCLFCKARDYDGQEGIIHQDTCIIKRIRLEAK